MFDFERKSTFNVYCISLFYSLTVNPYRWCTTKSAGLLRQKANSFREGKRGALQTICWNERRLLFWGILER